MKTTSFFYVFCFLLVLPCTAAKEDDECLLCDAMVGAAVAVCEEFSACRAFMLYMGMAAFVVVALMCIAGGSETRRELWHSAPSWRGAACAAGGYSVTKACLSRQR